MKKCLVHIVLLFFFSFISSGEIKAQSDTTTRIQNCDTCIQLQKKFNKKWLVGPALLANTMGMVYLEYKWWWEGNYHPFNFKYEGFLNNYSYGVDKVGHFYISYLYFHSIYNAMKWAEFSERKSLLASTIIPAIYAISVEIGDGYSSYNFSPDDLASNLTGIGYGVLQQKVPFFKNFNIKWSYFPSRGINKNKKKSLTDDYDGHIYWMTFDVHNLLPGNTKRYWPSFLNLAVGYGVKNKVAGIHNPEARKFTFGLDYNISSIPLKGSNWKLVKNILDLFHFPAPGVRKIQRQPATFEPLLLN